MNYEPVQHELSARQRSILIIDGPTGMKRGGNVQDALVAGAAETQRFIAFGLDKRAVYQHVNLLKKCPLARVVHQRFERKARIAPDILVCPCLDSACQLGKSFRLIHRIAARKGDIGIGVGLDDAHNVVGRHAVSALKVPRLGIVTARTLVTAACTVDGGPEARTVNHRVFYDV